MRYLLAIVLLTVSFLSQARTVTLTTKNTVILRGEVSSTSVAEVEKDIIEAVKKRGRQSYTIYLVLDSPGGSIVDGEDLIQFLKPIRGLETISLFAASMASAIVEALPGKRLLPENGTLMFHRATGGFSGQFETGEVEARLFYAKTIVRQMEVRNASRLGITLEAYKNAVHNELWLYSSQNLGKIKAADEMIDLVCTKQLIDKRIEGVLDIGFGIQVKVSASGCPLLKGMSADAMNTSDEVLKAFKHYQETYRNSSVLRQ